MLESIGCDIITGSTCRQQQGARGGALGPYDETHLWNRRKRWDRLCGSILGIRQEKILR